MKYITCAFALVAYVAGAFADATPADAKPTIDTVWSVDVDQRLPNEPIALSHPAVVQHGSDTWVVLAGRDAWVHVYDLQSGSEVKRFFLGHASDSGAIALADGLVALGDIKGHVYVVNPDTAEIVWQKSLGSSFTILPQAIDHDFLIQTADNAVYRFSASGEKRWRYSGTKNTLSLYLGATPLVHGDVVYAVENNGDTVALKADTGDLLWKRQTILSSVSVVLSDLKAPLAQPSFMPSLNWAGEQVKDALLVPIFQGDLVVLSASDGSQSFSLPVSLQSKPLILDAQMYMADSQGFLNLYNAEKGKRLWSKKISSSALMGPVFFADSLWLTDNDGHVFRVSMDGEIEDSISLQGHIARLPVLTKQGLIIRTDRGEMTLVK
jgi:outer membrane protein assembly factor BamB